MAKSTVMVRVRLPVELVAKIQRRAEKYPGAMTVSGYIKMTMEYMVNRKHIKTRGNKEGNGRGGSF